MYCRNCGKEAGERDVFCTVCGTRIRDEKAQETEVFCDTATEHIGQPEDRLDNLKEEDSKKKSTGKRWWILKVVFSLLCIVAVAVGAMKLYTLQQEKNAKEEERRRELQIKSTLSKLGNRSSGSNDFNTAQYSMAFLFFSGAALGESNISNHDGMSAKEIKKDCMKTLKRYFDGSERDYLKSYAALMFCADYFDKEDVEYFYNGTKLASSEIRECMEELMFQNHISLSALLINELDRQICYTTNLRIRLTEDGYIETEEMISELYQFVYAEKSIRTIDEELLSEEITYQEVASDMEGSFTGREFYYRDLSPVGKMVFLYLMPRYVVQFDKDAGSDLWNFYFERDYNRCWEEIIHREMFSGIIE